jgi:hypothetical protein
LHRTTKSEILSAISQWLMDLYFILFCASAALLLLFHFFEVHYLRRMLWCMAAARFFKKSKHILDETSLKSSVSGRHAVSSVVQHCSDILMKEFFILAVDTIQITQKLLLLSLFHPDICLTNDIDTFVTHMNNVSAHISSRLHFPSRFTRRFFLF